VTARRVPGAGASRRRLITQMRPVPSSISKAPPGGSPATGVVTTPTTVTGSPAYLSGSSPMSEIFVCSQPMSRTRNDSAQARSPRLASLYLHHQSPSSCHLSRSRIARTTYRAMLDEAWPWRGQIVTGFCGMFLRMLQHGNEVSDSSDSPAGLFPLLA
jgi:hypothetical protein